MRINRIKTFKSRTQIPIMHNYRKQFIHEMNLRFILSIKAEIKFRGDLRSSVINKYFFILSAFSVYSLYLFKSTAIEGNPENSQSFKTKTASEKLCRTHKAKP